MSAKDHKERTPNGPIEDKDPLQTHLLPDNADPLGLAADVGVAVEDEKSSKPILKEAIQNGTMPDLTRFRVADSPEPKLVFVLEGQALELIVESPIALRLIKLSGLSGTWKVTYPNQAEITLICPAISEDVLSAEATKLTLIEAAKIVIIKLLARKIIIGTVHKGDFNPAVYPNNELIKQLDNTGKRIMATSGHLVAEGWLKNSGLIVFACFIHNQFSNDAVSYGNSAAFHQLNGFELMAYSAVALGVLAIATVKAQYRYAAGSNPNLTPIPSKSFNRLRYDPVAIEKHLMTLTTEAVTAPPSYEYLLTKVTAAPLTAPVAGAPSAAGAQHSPSLVGVPAAFGPGASTRGLMHPDIISLLEQAPEDSKELDNLNYSLASRDAYRSEAKWTGGAVLTVETANAICTMLTLFQKHLSGNPGLFAGLVVIGAFGGYVRGKSAHYTEITIAYEVLAREQYMRTRQSIPPFLDLYGPTLIVGERTRPVFRALRLASPLLSIGTHAYALATHNLVELIPNPGAKIFTQIFLAIGAGMAAGAKTTLFDLMRIAGKEFGRKIVGTPFNKDTWNGKVGNCLAQLLGSNYLFTKLLRGQYTPQILSLFQLLGLAALMDKAVGAAFESIILVNIIGRFSKEKANMLAEPNYGGLSIANYITLGTGLFAALPQVMQGYKAFQDELRYRKTDESPATDLLARVAQPNAEDDAFDVEAAARPPKPTDSSDQPDYEYEESAAYHQPSFT